MITLQNDSLKVEISQIGGELQSIYDKKDATEYLWQADPAYWKGKAPNLFPYIARCTEGKYTYQGNTYHLERHGFIRHAELSVEIHTDEMAVFSMADSEDTRKVYPFSFRYLLQYRLIGRMLQITCTVENRGAKKMYFGVGGHPGFQVPIEKNIPFEDYYLEFSENCTPKQVLFTENCLVSEKRRDFELENNRRIPLRHELFDDDAVVLQDAARAVTLKSDKGKHQIVVQYPDMRYIGFWHMPHTDAPYVCIEPWTSLPSRDGIIEDLETQPDLVGLESGKTYENRWSVSCL